jgi:glycerol-3-phosphate acyltransferase PlsY
VTLELAIVAAAYVLGSLPTAYLLVRLRTGDDIRSKGSGNVGGTNALRTAGWRVGVVVTLVDIAKGVIAVWLMQRFNPESGWIAAALLAAVIGHCYPVWLGFAGGKGVATGFGVFLVIAPLSAVAALGLWIVVLLVGRRVALASMLASAGFPIILKLIDAPDLLTLGAVAGVSVIIILRHSSNIRRMLSGEEHTIDDQIRR